MNGKMIATAVGHQMNEVLTGLMRLATGLDLDFPPDPLGTLFGNPALVELIGKAYFGLGADERLKGLVLPAREKQAAIGKLAQFFFQGCIAIDGEQARKNGQL